MADKPTYEELEYKVKVLEREAVWRKQAEDALRKSEEKYRQHFENVSDVIYLIDPDFRVISVSLSVERILGYKPEELIGRPFQDLNMLAPEYLEKAFSETKRVLAGERIDSSEYEFISKDGTRKFGEVSGGPLVRDGKVIAVISVARDITKRKQVEEALRESEKRLEKINECFLSFGTDANENINRLTALCGELLGATCALYNRLDGDMLYSWGQWNTPVDYNPVDTPEGHICYDVIKSAGDEILVITNLPDTHYAQTDPNVIPYKLQTYVGRAVKLRDDYVGSLCVVYQVDIIPGEADKRALEIIASAIGVEEERKRAEVLLRDTEEKYHHAQKMEALGTLAGGVAHDLNNVLSGIVTYPDLLLTRIPKDSPLIKPILTMKDSGKKAAHIVQDLLTLARRGVVIDEVVNLNEIISEYLKAPEHEKLKSFHPGVEVETSLESDLFNTSGSPVHLSKAVMNLVSNAAEAMPDGGKIFISTENRYIDRPISGYESIEEGDYITLTVFDMGIGVSPEDKEVIFEPFYTKKVMGRSGTGLGMAVVWTTVKDHKGYIDFQSTEGKGTTFTLYFPATRRARAKKETILPIENYMGKGESILVVDDVRGQREIVFNLLTTLGYEVDTVSSGEEAVEYLKEHNVDLIILDMIMPPGIDGLDTYKEILELHPDQKAIIASGFSETDRVREAQRLGAGQYIKKPYTLEKIGIAVRDALRK